jgi:transglutaminase-like putative cysteine protease
MIIIVIEETERGGDVQIADLAHDIIFATWKYIGRLCTWSVFPYANSPRTMLNFSPGRCVVRLFAVILTAFMCSSSGQAKPLEYKVGPAPAWVHPVTAASASRLQGSGYGGVEMLLSDNQTRIEAGGQTGYRHYASKALDSKGVQDVAAISLTFDPTYQKLTLNAVDVIRDGQRIGKLGSATIRVLHRETELEYQLFDGNRTINVAIDDVRIGDIVEYSYSLAGLNPVFNNKVAGGTYLQWGVPVDRVFARLLVPLGRALAMSAQNTRVQAAMTEANGYRDYRWTLDSVPALRVEKDAPAGFDPYASVQWSEFPDWESVVAWALPLYRTPASAGAAVLGEVERIRTSAATPEQRLLDVLHLVQRDIRYLGVEVGPGSHAPSSPTLVYKRRFGDCKDKAMLTVTMLEALGIEASPALVNTERSIGPAMAATPHAFNHVLVRATLGGKTYWIDPTRSPQKGDLAHLYQADYGLALVLDQASRALVPMAPPVNARTTIRTVFDSSRGFDTPVRYTIATTVRGAAAENMRAQIASRGLADKQMDYLNYYARTYPGIKVAAPLAIFDDEKNNTIVLTESYLIADFWPRQKGKTRREAYIDSAEIEAKLSAPKAVNRIAPLRVSFPEEIDELTEVKLPEEWDIAEKNNTVSDAAFVYVNRVKQGADGRSMVVANTYKALSDRVAPGAMAAYAANLRSADNKVGHRLYWSEPDEPAPVTVKGKGKGKGKGKFDGRVTAGVLIFCAWVWLGLLFLTTPAAHRDTDLKLLLIFMAISVTPLVAAIELANVTGPVCFTVATAFLGALYLPTISAYAPASHWIYRLQYTGAGKFEPGLMFWLKNLPMLLVFVLLMYLLVNSVI